MLRVYRRKTPFLPPPQESQDRAFDLIYDKLDQITDSITTLFNITRSLVEESRLDGQLVSDIDDRLVKIQQENMRLQSDIAALEAREAAVIIQLDTLRDEMSLNSAKEEAKDLMILRQELNLDPRQTLKRSMTSLADIYRDVETPAE